MHVSLLTMVLLAGGREMTAAESQRAVGPAAPQPATVTIHERNLHLLLSSENVDKAWQANDAAKANQLLMDLQDAQTIIEKIVGPVAPKPNPKPEPVTPRPNPRPEPAPPGEKPKPDLTAIEGAAAALHDTLEDASRVQPSLRLPADADAQLRRITDALRAVQ